MGRDCLFCFVCLHTVDAGWFFRNNSNDDRMAWGVIVCFVLFVYILLMQVGFFQE